VKANKEYKLEKAVVGGIISTIGISLTGLMACKISSELGGPMLKACQTINLMLSLPSGTFVVLGIVLIGMIIKSVRSQRRTVMV
jgi:hypothetical protein